MSRYTRIPYYKIPLPAVKASPKIHHHKKNRNDMLCHLPLKFPIYNRIPDVWRLPYEKGPPIINQEEIKGTKRPQASGLWEKNEKGFPERVQDTIPLVVNYTEEVHKGLWGGEGIVSAFRYARGLKSSPRFWKNWRPPVYKRELYSEVLDQTFKTTVTPRTLDQIDAAFGFDHYILKTPVNELASNLGSKLKRQMLFRLLNKDTEMYPDDPKKREIIFNRYKRYMVSKSEAEWVGLNLKEAMTKQWEIEKESGLHDPVPLLEVYTKELKESLLLYNKSPDTMESKQPDTPDNDVFEAPVKP